MNLLSLIVYVPLQIVFLPFAILGGLLVAYRQLVVSKRIGVSQTAIEVLNARWTMHIFGIRDDEPTARLAAALPNTSRFGLWLALFPLWVKHAISRRLFLYPRVPEPGHEGLGEMMIVRTLHFDRMIRRAIGDVGQVVVMGAGYDMRAYGGLRREGVTFFELDQAKVQRHKREALAAAGIPSDHVRFVEIDFQIDAPFEKLRDAGFDPSRKALFLWEGVTLYLSEADVRRMIRALREKAAPGSLLLADFYAKRFVDIAAKKAIRKTLDYTDEGLGFGLPFATDHERVLRAFVQSEGMALGEVQFMGAASDKGPFMVVAEMRI